MKNRYYRIISGVMLLCLTLSACRDITSFMPQEKLSFSLLKAYYRYIDRTPYKYEAAQFLTDNMKYHSSRGKYISIPDSLDRWFGQTDSTFHQFLTEYGNENFGSKEYTDSLRKIQRKYRETALKDTIPQAIINMDTYADSKEISFSFLKKHIDYAFQTWNTSPYAQKLSFDEFKEAVLPYRSIAGVGFHETNTYYANHFTHYFDTSDSLNQIIRRYNRLINNLRDLNGTMDNKKKYGIYDLFNRIKLDCVPMAHYNIMILRSLGIPSFNEFIPCYRDYVGRHFHCTVKDSDGEWKAYNPEVSIPGENKWNFAPTMNVYRQYYGAQKDSPYFLKKENEFIPTILSHPCIKDVTSYLMTTYEIELPFNNTTHSGNIAYLATFNRENNGIFPATWGLIDSVKQLVKYNNVIPGRLYFPIYYTENGEIRFFDQPFHIKADSIHDKLPARAEQIHGIQTGQSDKITIVVKRKFPRKPNMIKIADELIGSRFLGANRADFKDATTLLEITEAPEPYFKDYPLKNTKSYKFYRFEASPQYKRTHIAMLEWLTTDAGDYPHTLRPTRQSIITSRDTALLKKDKHLTQLVDIPDITKRMRKSEYDGKMTSSPSIYPTINFRPIIPCKITNVRFAPKNADNGIHAGDEFELLYWKQGWQSVGFKTAEYEFVVFDNVPSGTLYWLRNHSQGKEEIPFIIEDGEQRFLYYDFLNT